jgi:hypothetical protein
MQIGVRASSRTQEFFLEFLNLHIWKRYDRLLNLFLLLVDIGRNCPTNYFFDKPLTVFPLANANADGRWS